MSKPNPIPKRKGEKQKTLKDYADVSNQSQILEKDFPRDIEILHEQFSATIELSENESEVKQMLSQYGFDILHEESNIYTIKLE